MLWLWITIPVLAVMVLGLFAIYFYSFFTPHPGQNNPFRYPDDNEQYAPYKEAHLAGVRKLLDSEFENVSIRSFDGIRLAGKYYAFGGEGAPLCICFHGWRGLDVRDFRGGVDLLMRMKCNVLLTSERGHGESGGHTLTFGINERRDAISWTEYAVNRFGPEVRILWFGVSMGAATVLMASGLETPPQLKGIVADAPYGVPKEIISLHCKRGAHLPPRIFYPLVTLSGFLFGHFRLNSASAVEAVKKAKVPILIVHGDDDRFVPIEMSREILPSNPDIRYEVFPGAGHVLSCLKDPERYEAMIRDFTARCLG
ncbi:MAG: dienelactone hydrolase family protein [Lachnospiraceae bacterium]|nr:dienelactone hydrolase family protein [Lachnospiraceae bacterium]